MRLDREEIHDELLRFDIRCRELDRKLHELEKRLTLLEKKGSDV